MLAILKIIGYFLSTKAVKNSKPTEVPTSSQKVSTEVPDPGEIWYALVAQDNFKLNTWYPVEEYRVICMAYNLRNNSYVVAIYKDDYYVWCYQLKLRKPAKSLPTNTDIMPYTEFFY